MRGLSLHLSYTALFVGLFAAAQSMPGPRMSAAAVEPERVSRAFAPDEGALQASRLAGRAKLEQAFADARPPVPLLREFKPTALYVSPDAFEPSVVAVAQLPALAPARSAAAAPTAKAKIEQDGYRGVRLIERAADGKWRAVAMRGNTEVALVVDERGNVSTQ